MSGASGPARQVSGALIEGVSLGRVYLEMWCRVPGHDEFSSRGLQHAVTGGSEWAACETPCFLKAGERPDLIKLNASAPAPS